MKGVLELLFNELERYTGLDNHTPGSAYTRMFNIERENGRMLSESMTKEQKNLLDAYSIAKSNTEEIVRFERFCCAFYLGVQLATELAQKEVLPK